MSLMSCGNHATHVVHVRDNHVRHVRDNHVRHVDRAAAAFMITGPAAKITNLGALKIVLGSGSFACYLAFALIFSLAVGAVVSVVCYQHCFVVSRF